MQFSINYYFCNFISIHVCTKSHFHSADQTNGGKRVGSNDFSVRILQSSCSAVHVVSASYHTDVCQARDISARTSSNTLACTYHTYYSNSTFQSDREAVSQLHTSITPHVAVIHFELQLRKMELAL